MSPYGLLNGSEGLPMLLNGCLIPSPRGVSRCLRYVDRWRRYLFLKWLRTAGQETDRATAAAAVDQLIATAMLVEFVEQRTSSSVDLAGMTASLEPTSISRLVQELQARLRDPILALVLTPPHPASETPVPLPVMQSPWLDRLLGGIRVAFGDRIPPSLFGMYHELCVGAPLVDVGANDDGQDGAVSVRHARGVHYTPAALVDYLVFRTLEPLSENIKRDPQAFRILDPSCGCGAFLIAALRYILNALEERRASPSDCHKAASPGAALQEGLDVLSTMICGCDIDEQAVAWTKRLLLLTFWEVVGPTPDNYLQAPNALAPDLQSNILCRSFLDPVDSAVAGETAGFRGGFDVVIGGPPFVRLHELYRSQPGLIDEYRGRFASAAAGQFDLYMLFIEQALRLLRPGGRLAFSVSNTFLRSESGRTLRRVIADQGRVTEVVEIEDSKVYPDATTQIVLLSLQKTRGSCSTRHVRVKGRGGLRGKLARLCARPQLSTPDLVIRDLLPEACSSEEWRLVSVDEKRWLSTVEMRGRPLADLPVDVGQGISTGADDAFLLRLKGLPRDGRVLAEERRSGQKMVLEAAAVRPIVRGREIRGFRRTFPRTICVVPCDEKGHLLPEEALAETYPLAFRYLGQHRARLAARKRAKGVPWFAPARSERGYAAGALRVVASKIDAGGGFTIEARPEMLFCGGVVVVTPHPPVDPHFLLGVLNSAVFWEFIRLNAPTMGHGRHVYRLSTVRRFPLIMPASDRDLRLFAEIIETARRICDAHEREQKRQEQIESLDQMVRDLYGLAASPGDRGA